MYGPQPGDPFFRLTHDLLAEIGPDGIIRRANPAWETILGFPPDQLQGTAIADLVEPDDRDRLWAALEAAHSNGPAVAELHLRDRGGESRWLDWVTAVDPETSVAYVAARDVSAARRAADAIRLSEARYRELFASHPVAMAVWDPTSLRILDANDAAIVQYGYSREEIAGLTIDRLVHPADWDRLMATVPSLGTGIAGGAIFRHIRKDGSVIEVEMTGHGLTVGGRPARVVMALDVTARRRLEEQLREAHKMEAIGRLAGGIAHDFNNLLTAINGYSELLLAALPSGDPRRSDAEQIQLAGQRAAAITGQLLAFSRRQLLKPQVVDVHAAVRRIEPTLRSLIGIRVELRLDLEARDPFIMADAPQLEQILINLAVNGRDAMPGGGVLTIGTANLAAGADQVGSDELGTDEVAGDQGPGMQAAGEQVVLSVSDTGLGMNEFVRRQIFEPFFTTKGFGQGTGLGLASVYGTVRQSGGQIRVRSEPGQGSTFRVAFPRASAADRGVRPAAPPSRPLPSASGTILLVEDEPIVRALIRVVLERTGYTILEAPDGPAALAIADEHPQIDLLLADVVMPGMTGLELARRVAGKLRGLPIVLMSGYAEEGLPPSAAADNEMGFVAKPFTTESLEGAVREALDRSRRRPLR
ncbi:MAG TPA: PAS domain S-box protein [Candidatus Limnocylindria bacterium]|nr:PAS domain S-box protein [Candidatus Limnocylindria bacterium]